MKAKHIILIFVLVALAAAGGWFAAQNFGSSHAGGPAAGGGRKVKFYQSAMHPWITSDKPGKCTVCGMELTPVYEGDKGIAIGGNVVSLGSNAIQVVNVQTELVQRRPLVRTLRVAGTIEENERSHRRMAAYVEGRIEQLHVNFIGAEVTAGQPLATFYSPTLLAAEREYQSLLRTLPAGDFPALRDEHARLVAAAKLRLQRYGLNDAQLAALATKADTNFFTPLLAPMSGTVIARDVYEGQYVKEGDKLFELADFSTMWFQFDLYERDLAWVKVGQPVEVTTPSLPGRVFSAAVAFLDPNIADPTRSAKARVELPNPLVATNGLKRRELFHKLYAEAAVKLDIPEVLAVPRLAVLNTGDRVVAYVDLGGGNYEQRQLKLGRRGDEHWEILAGLSEGDRIVTTGNLLLDGQAQLNQNIAAPAPAEPKTEPLPPLSEPQLAAAKTFLTVADAVTAALAGDNLADYNTHAAKLHPALPALAAALAEAAAWQPLVKRLDTAGHLAAASDLTAARKAFHPFSEATVAFAKALRAQPGELAALKVFQCPMTDEAFPGAPKKSQWLQLQGPVRNPYFGAKMLDCGAEVKP